MKVSRPSLIESMRTYTHLPTGGTQTMTIAPIHRKNKIDSSMLSFLLDVLTLAYANVVQRCASCGPDEALFELILIRQLGHLLDSPRAPLSTRRPSRFL